MKENSNKKLESRTQDHIRSIVHRIFKVQKAVKDAHALLIFTNVKIVIVGT